ncbi:MAG TPA: hypothetical protein PK562_06205 [Candidatus Omnitrophota bacterium]|nr:hypothetical protein [Candidatus Omnitrophota bacterium]
MEQGLYRNITGIFCAFFVMGLTITNSIAANDTQAPAEDARDLKRITGTVAKVSFVFSTIMLTCELGYITFKVPDDTTIVRGGREIKIEEIKTGETITIQYSQPSPSEYVAVYIRASEEYTE